MWLLRDIILVVGLLIMAVAFVIGGAGYIFALGDLRTEAITWGLTANDVLFIILGLSFWVVVVRLLFRLRQAENARRAAETAVSESTLRQQVDALKEQVTDLSARQIPLNRFGRPMLRREGGSLTIEDDDGTVMTTGL